MGVVTQEQVIDQLRTVMDPELHKDLVTLDMVKDVTVDGSTVSVKVELTTPACPLKSEIGADIEAAVKRIEGVERVEIEWGARVRAGRDQGAVLPGVKNIIAVGAGKGGVGKSTVAVMLAVGLRRAGATVGLMDADVYGPSIPTMMGIQNERPAVRDEMIEPLSACGLKVMSIGFMIDPDKAVIWRGPMVHGVVKQFLEQVDWGELDYLILDLPPGTGDVPLTLAQTLPMTGSIIVCTPQDIALLDARRAIKMYDQLNIPCLGIVENMSYYLCPECGHRDDLFAHGGAAAAAKELGVAFLGEIPLNTQIRIHGDGGTPEQIFTKTDDYVRSAVQSVVSNIAAQISVRSQLQVVTPTLSMQ